MLLSRGTASLTHASSLDRLTVIVRRLRKMGTNAVLQVYLSTEYRESFLEKQWTFYRIMLPRWSVISL